MATIDRSFFPKMGLVLLAGMVLYFPSSGQTGPGNGGAQTLFSQSYDTLVAGQGYGKYTLHFPSWDPGSGKLVAVRIRAQVSVQYGFTLRNVDSLSDTYTVVVGREDPVGPVGVEAGKGSTVVRMNNLGTLPGNVARLNDSMASVRVGSFLLDPDSGQSQVPYTLLNNFTKTDSITEHLDSYMGEGGLQFDYSPVTWSNVISDNHSKFYYSAVMRDSTRFSVTYLYTGKPGPADSGLIHPPVGGGDPGMVVYPNPATDFILLVFSGSRDWQVNIFTADGRLVQGNNFFNTNRVQVNFSHKLPSGVYFVRAIDSGGNRSQVGTFVVR
jgi:type IX secretion system substrate protein